MFTDLLKKITQKDSNDKVMKEINAYKVNAVKYPFPHITLRQGEAYKLGF